MKIGFIGVGNMGRPMALNLLKKTGSLYIYDVSAQAVEAMEKAGAKYLPLSEMAEQCQLVFMMLPNGKISRDTLFGQDGLAARRGALRLVVDMSSVTAADAKACADGLAKQQIGFLDAPVSGGMAKAQDGTLAFMVGGSEDDLQLARPYLEAMGASVERIGGVGSGCVTKLANQVIVSALLGAVGEALTLAAKAGTDPARVYDAIKDGLAQNRLMDSYIPKILERDFQPGGVLALNLKDVNNILATAEELGAAVPVTSLMREIMTSEELKNCQTEDHRAVVKYFEQKSGVTIQTKA